MVTLFTYKRPESLCILKLRETSHMVESFNGWIFLIIYLLNWAGGAMYAYQTVFNTVPWLSKYGIHESAVLPTRVLGTFVSAGTLLGLFILFRANGPDGTWPFFVFNFLQALIFVVVGYTTVTNSNAAKLEGVKYTAEAYIAPAVFTVLNGILIYGLGDKIW